MLTLIHPCIVTIPYSTNLDALTDSLQHSIDNLIDWTEMNHMTLHPDKTKFMLITTRQKRQNLVTNLPPLTIKSDVIEEVQDHKVLGIIIDNNLSWTPHVNALCKKIPTKVYELPRLKHFVNFRTRKRTHTHTYKQTKSKEKKTQQNHQDHHPTPSQTQTHRGKQTRSHPLYSASRIPHRGSSRSPESTR